MNPGNFSVSLAVKDIHKSRAFYETLGFEAVSGDMAQNWIVMQNGTTIIGLFQGMFEENMLTFNPKWNIDREKVEDAEDVRDIQAKLILDGYELDKEIDAEDEGPAHFYVTDPDGNKILFDQHV